MQDVAGRNKATMSQMKAPTPKVLPSSEESAVSQRGIESASRSPASTVARALDLDYSGMNVHVALVHRALSKSSFMHERCGLVFFKDACLRVSQSAFENQNHFGAGNLMFPQGKSSLALHFEIGIFKSSA